MYLRNRKTKHSVIYVFIRHPIYCNAHNFQHVEIYEKAFFYVVVGYIVFSGVRRSNGVQGLRVIVQSDKCPEYVERRIEVFLRTMKVKPLDTVCHGKFGIWSSSCSLFVIHIK